MAEAPGPRVAPGLRVALALLPLLVALQACSGTPEAEEAPPAPLVLDVAPVTSAEQLDPLEAEARAAVADERLDDARRAYELLALRAPSPVLRAEYLYNGAECALGSGDPYLAYQTYARLIQTYPGTQRFPRIVERIFLIGRLFAEGKAEKPSWLLGIWMTDREFGVQVLERFQQARERHPLADDALHHVALAQHALGEWELAIAAWEKLIQTYAGSEWTETAEFRIGLTMLEMSDGPEYDKVPLIVALERLRRYRKRHPTGDHATAASEAIARVEEGLAAQQLVLARFYLRKDRPFGAQLYLEAIQREFPASEAAREAKELLAKLPKTSPPPAPPDPGGLKVPEGTNEDRLRLAPTPINETW